MTTLERILPDGRVATSWRPTADSPAVKLAWTSNSTRSANFANYRVVASGGFLRVKPTLRKRMFGVFFLLISTIMTPVAIIMIGVATGSAERDASEASKWLSLVLALLFMLPFWWVGFTSLFARAKFTIDLQRQRYYLGYKDKRLLPSDPKLAGSLAHVVGVQLLSRRVKTKISHSTTDYNRNWTSYQINLVLNSNERVCLLDHANYKSVRRDAEIVGRKMNLEVWARG